VKFIIRHDKRKSIYFAPLQSEAAKKLLSQRDENLMNIDSVVYFKCDAHYIKSRAILHLLKDIGGIWKIFYPLIFIPVFISDSIYDIIAANRFRIFGKRDSCMIPSPDNKERFIS
jgi:predicted DCC family thiol-disulfide oxidoreductase YuxK